MNEQDAVLVELTPELKAEFLEMAEEYSAAGEDRYQSALDDFENYLRQLQGFFCPTES
jgi:hypothetical protein